MISVRRAVWEMWTPDMVVTIVEAVALSMNIDPECLRHHWKDFSEDSFEFKKRYHVASRSIKTLEVSLAKFAAIALSWGWQIPPQMSAMAANLLPEAKSVPTAMKKSQKQSEATIERHASKRERTLAAVLATIATADREAYIKRADQSIIASKLAGLVDDNRLKYEKGGKILTLEEIKNLVGKVLKGDYFS